MTDGESYDGGEEVDPVSGSEIKRRSKRGTIRLDQLSDDELTFHVVALMSQAARELKMSPTDLTWVDFARHAKYAFGKDQYGVIAPRHITRIGGFNMIRDAFFPPSTSRIKIEREEIRRRAKLHRSTSLTATSNALFLQQMQEMAEHVFKGRIMPSEYSLKKRNPLDVERDLNVLLSDLHFRALLDPREVPLAYGPKEERRRFAAIMAQAADWKPQYRKNTRLLLHILGDIIQNMLHDDRDGAPLAEQVCAAIWYISHAVEYVSQNFPFVEVMCTPGNHGRNRARHQNRAIHQKWDAIETHIYYACYMASIHLKNVKWHIPYAPYYTWDSFGMRGFGTHGDTVLEPGNPDRDIKVGRVRNQINEINASLPNSDEYKIFVTGHVHTASVTNLRNGATLVTNGAIIPPDPFAVNLAVLENQCGQQMWESVPGRIFGDHRFISVDRHTDHDRSLDKLIKPFPGLPG